MPEELWMEAYDTVQEASIKTIPKKNKCKRSTMAVWGRLKIAVDRREVRSKRES